MYNDSEWWKYNFHPLSHIPFIYIPYPLIDWDGYGIISFKNQEGGCFMIKEYTIYDVPPSNNKYMGSGSRGKNFQYQREKKEWAEKVKSSVGIDIPDKPFNKSIVTLRYYFKTRHSRDPDNYSGKFLLDGLIEANIIEDDSFNHIKLLLEGDYDKDLPRTVITVEKVENF